MHKKIFLLGSVALALVAFFVLKGRPKGIVCEAAENPFDDNPMMSESEYQGGYYPNVEIAKVCKFSGKVRKGEVYKQEITNSLTFCLVPSKKEGWTISVIISTENCEENSSVYVTPPWHGENEIYIHGYQFRNIDNTAENDGSVNAPQKTRYFNFILDLHDYEFVKNNPRCWYYGYECPDDQKPIRYSRGVMNIMDLQLGNLVPNKQAWIESMSFDVMIYLPLE